MSPWRSVTARLSVALLLVVAAALAIVYFLVVPSLERQLIENKLDQLERAARNARLPDDPVRWQPFAERTAPSVNARVIVYSYLNVAPLTLSSFADSGVTLPPLEDDEVAQRAASQQAFVRETVERNGRRFAEAAIPIRSQGAVLLMVAPLDDALASVNLVERRILQTGVFALAVALALGYAGARVFTRRIRRLEQAAERIAAGEFDEPVVDTGGDELGQLALAFDRMRERLAGLDHARREFIANASHELRTPLFSLGGYVELLDEEELDDETRAGFVREMRQQLDRLTKLASELLDLSRLDAGRLRVESEPIDMAAIGDLLVNDFGPLARARGHALEREGDAEAWALADGQRVVQIGSSLVENALRHTPEGTAVRVRVAHADGRVILAVEDDGAGIPPEHRGHVFERFYRVDGTLASGSGLGLAIARELAELMGGSLELDSPPGRTVFTLELPAVAAEQLERLHVKTEPAVST